MTATAAFRYLKNDCPVCNGARKDCRQSNTTNAVHCRSDARPSGWEATGFDTQGFSIWVQGSQASDPGYWAQRERQNLERQQAKAANRSKLLGIPERAKQWAAIIQRSPLSLRHRYDLDRRCRQAELPDGTADRIAQGLAFTWQGGASIPGVSFSLPGTDHLGRLRKDFRGMAIAVPNAEGQVLGAQIKPDGGSGYYWASSANKGGNGPALPSGENPMGVYWPSTITSNRIGLGEGYLKPAIGAERLEHPFLGISGGLFAQAPQQVEAAITAIAAKLPGQPELVLYPDAGMLSANHANVHSAWRGLFRLAEKLGYRLRIAWWGQDDKAQGDVDEAPLAAIQGAQLITPAQLEERLKAAQQGDWQAKAHDAAKAAWERCRRYTPTETFNKPHPSLTLADLEHTDIHGLRSGMGTGKTYAIADFVEEAESTDRGMLSLGSRNGLLLQSCEKWQGFYHLHKHEAFGLTADPQSRIACCVDSLLHFADKDFDGRYLLIDEVTSVIKHVLTSSTLKGKREKVLAKLEQAVKRAHKIIAWDGNNSDMVLSYLARLRGEGTRVTKQLNEFVVSSLNVELVRVLSKEGTVWRDNYKPILHRLETALNAYHSVTEGPRALAVVADNQLLLKSLDEVYTEQGFKVLRIDSETITLESVQAIVKNPDGYFSTERVDLLLMSPTVESGFDVSIENYFAKGFGLFFGNLDTATQMQFLRRVRACLDWSVWCVEYCTHGDTGASSAYARQLGQQVIGYANADGAAALAGEESNLLEQFADRLKAESSSVHVQASLQVMAARNYERQHTRECLQQSLIEAGHTVNVIDIPGEAVADTPHIDKAKDDILKAEAHATFHSPHISASEAARIKSSFSASLEQRRSADRAILLARLPGIEETPEWMPDLVLQLLFKNRGLLRQLERYWMLQNMDAAKNRSRETWLLALEHNSFLLDVKSDYRLLQALKELGLDKLLDGDGHDNNSPVVQSIYNRCKRSKPMQIALGRSPGKLSPCDWVGRLCRIVGIDSQGRMKHKALRGEEGGDRLYSYSAPTDDPTNAALLDAIGRRFEKFQQKPPEAQAPQAFQGDHLALPITTIQAAGDPPSTADDERVTAYSEADVAEVAEMKVLAAQDCIKTLEALRRLIAPDLWRMAG